MFDSPDKLYDSTEERKSVVPRVSLTEKESKDANLPYMLKALAKGQSPWKSSAFAKY